MSTLDDIAKERERLAERLAKIDGERAKVAEELAELEAAERVLVRLSKARPDPARRGRRAAPKAAPVSLGDATLHAVEAHGPGASAADVRKFLAEELGMQVRPNHLGMALQRHRRAGRLQQRDLLWYPPQPHGAEAGPS
jgi:hypothetical protein